jgi:Protein of unknown function (DUF559)
VGRIPPALSGRPFTTSEAHHVGLGRGVLSGPYVHRVFSGVYMAADSELTERSLVAAALAVLPPDSRVAGVTALRLFGVGLGPAAPLQFVTTHPHQVRRPSIHVMRVETLPPTRGITVVPEHAFVTAARQLDLVDLVAAGDWLVRLRLGTPCSLLSYAEAFTGRHRLLVRRAARLVRARVDSPRETRLRICLVLAGIPEPECNLTLGTNDFPIGRVDLVYLEFKVIIEYEGDQHRTDSWQWNVDIGRQEEFAAAGWLVIRVTAERMRHPRRVVARVYEALRNAGYGGPEPVFSAEWCRLFE